MENILTAAQIKKFESLGFTCECLKEENDQALWICRLGIPDGKIFNGLNIYTDGTVIIVDCEEYTPDRTGQECTINQFPFSEEKLLEVTSYLRSI